MSLLNVESYVFINVFYLVLFCIHVSVDDVIKNIYISVNLNKGCIYVSKERVSNLLETVEYITSHPYVPERALAKLEVKIISTKFVLGDITQLKTRFIYKCIESKVS